MFLPLTELWVARQPGFSCNLNTTHVLFAVFTEKTDGNWLWLKNNLDQPYGSFLNFLDQLVREERSEGKMPGVLAAAIMLSSK